MSEISVVVHVLEKMLFEEPADDLFQVAESIIKALDDYRKSLPKMERD